MRPNLKARVPREILEELIEEGSEAFGSVLDLHPSALYLPNKNAYQQELFLGVQKHLFLDDLTRRQERGICFSNRSGRLA